MKTLNEHELTGIAGGEFQPLDLPPASYLPAPTVYVPGYSPREINPRPVDN